MQNSVLGCLGIMLACYAGACPHERTELLVEASVRLQYAHVLCICVCAHMQAAVYELTSQGTG